MKYCDAYKTDPHYRLCIILIVGLWVIFSTDNVWGQKEKAKLPEPRNIRVLEEHKESNGTIVRRIQYEQGHERITETVIIPASPLVNIHVPIKADTLNRDSLLLVVNKGSYNLEVYYRRKLIRSYKAVFGPKPLQNKVMEGDRCTPEGWYTIRSKNPSSRYDKFMQLNYPSDTAIARFNDLKTKGKVPQSARIGGDIGIHGIWKNGDDMIEKNIGWTDGCIALKNKDAEELYTFVGIGTRVYIRK